MAHHVEVLGNTVAAVHVTRHAGDIKRLATVAPFHHRNHLRGSIALIHEAAHL